MFLEHEDYRPPSLLRTGRVDLLALVGGTATAVIVHATVPLLVALFAVAVTAAGLVPPRAVIEDDESPTEIHFVDARFVKLGRQFEANELPNRIRTARSQAPRLPQLAAIPNRDSNRLAQPDAGFLPSDAVEGMLVALGNRASEVARVLEAAEREGDPEGIAEGTVSREEGDIYRGQIYAFFRRGLNRPTSLSDSELRGLRAIVSVTASLDGQISSYSMRSSGNADFDNAVRLRMDQAVGSFLPQPTDDETRAQYFGHAFNISVSPPR